MRVAFLCLIGAAACCGTAVAEDGCGRFAWPVAEERAALLAPTQPSVATGEALPAMPQQALSLHLAPMADARFAMPPERNPKDGASYGGTVRLPAPPASGIYQVALSQDTWIDIVQDGRYAHSVGSSGRRDCPGLRKTVRFDLAASPLVLQVSGAPAESLSVVFGPVH
jgi:hypothetical protein